MNLHTFALAPAVITMARLTKRDDDEDELPRVWPAAVEESDPHTPG